VSGRPGRTKRWPGRTWDRIASSAQERRGQKIPPIAALQDAIDKRIEEGDSEQDATLGVIEEFERSAATVNARTTPLVPASGIIITAAGILSKVGGAEAVLCYTAMAFAFGGLGYLASALFTHAGRPIVGVEPSRPDIAFARERLIEKESKAHKGAGSPSSASSSSSSSSSDGDRPRPSSLLAVSLLGASDAQTLVAFSRSAPASRVVLTRSLPWPGVHDPGVERGETAP
jgi:hypothetical protein